MRALVALVATLTAAVSVGLANAAPVQPTLSVTPNPAQALTPVTVTGCGYKGLVEVKAAFNVTYTTGPGVAYDDFGSAEPDANGCISVTGEFSHPDTFTVTVFDARGQRLKPLASVQVSAA